MIDRAVSRRHTLASGLTVCQFTMPGFHQKYAQYTTHFGAVDEVFITEDGVRQVTPAGVAHFLEHKVFEQKEGNALQMFAPLGASPNAFTSQTITAYHFECTDRFYESLELLLTFVNNPYFTEENVKKERGIIGQEIGMVNDNPAWRAYTGLFSVLFPDHRISTSVIGTVESIGRITPDTLRLCHGNFYSPGNMVLTVAGDVDFEKVCRIAEERTPKKGPAVARRSYETGEAFRGGPVRDGMEMAVSQPVYLLGFRDREIPAGCSPRRREAAATLAAELVCGPSSPLFSKLYGENYVTRDFETEYVSFPGGGALVAGGEGRDPERVFDAVLEETKRQLAEGLSEERFTRLARAALGKRLRLLDSPEGLCVAEAEAFFDGESIADTLSHYRTLRLTEVEAFMKEVMRPENAGLYQITPAGGQRA